MLETTRKIELNKGRKTMISNPAIIHLVEEETVNEFTNEIILPGWYFWDEVWCNRHGPFATIEECEEGLRNYCDFML